AQAFKHDPDFILGREVPACRPPDVLHHLLRRSLHRFFQGGFGLHLRSFVTTTKPKSSLIHNLKSVPLALTPDSTAFLRGAAAQSALPRHAGMKSAVSAGHSPGACCPSISASISSGRFMRKSIPGSCSISVT